jgi:hypothetical protein
LPYQCDEGQDWYIGLVIFFFAARYGGACLYAEIRGLGSRPAQAKSETSMSTNKLGMVAHVIPTTQEA